MTFGGVGVVEGREEVASMMLFRRLLGDVLRRHRQDQSRTLRDVAAAARISLGYLSEIERGRKEASSELLSSLCEALGISLADVLRDVSDEIAAHEGRRLHPIGFTGNSRVAVPSTGGTRVAATGRVAGVAPLLPGRPAPATTRVPVAMVSARPVAAA